MTTKTESRLRIIDSMLQRASLMESQPRSIDRYIAYFGDAQPRGHETTTAK